MKTRSRTALFGCLGSFAVGLLAIVLMFAAMTTRTKILDETATVEAGGTGVFGPVAFKNRKVHELDIDITGIKEGDTATVALQLVDEAGESYNMRYRQSKSGNRFDLNADFRPIPGTYTVRVAVQSSPAPCTVKVAAYSGVVAGWWLLAVIPIAGLLGVINLIRIASTRKT